ncbi:MAG: hypothetical protein WC101_00970 [Candidatus Gracilibacteria bacterium]
MLLLPLDIFTSMPKIQLSSEQLNLPENHEDMLWYEKHGLIWKFRKLNGEKDKFIVNISFPNEKKIGYMTFYVTHPPQDGRQLVFGGLYISDDLRGRGLGGLCMGELFAFSSQLQVPLHSAVPQEKPLTCSMLHKFGFAPKAISGDQVAIVGRSPLGSPKIPVHFPSKSSGEHFIHSRIARTGHYQLVGSIDEIVDGVRIVLNKRYLFQDEAKAQAQLQHTREKLLHFD